MRPPFNIMIIVGMTNCGKTHYLLDMLQREYKNHFDYIIIICPTFSWNRTYQEWKHISDEDVIPIECEQDQVDKILHIASEVYKGTNSLIILDDCASSQDVKNRTSELVKLAFSARHFGLSTIVITQQLTSIAKPYRENISKLVTFYNTNRNDMKTITDDYLSGADKDASLDITQKLKNNKHARLEIELIYPYSHKVVAPQVDKTCANI